MVAVCTKKDYMAVALPEHPLADSQWVSVDTPSTVQVLVGTFVMSQLMNILKNKTLF